MPGGLEFNPDAGKTNLGGTGEAKTYEMSGSQLIAARSNYEGPGSDTVQFSDSGNTVKDGIGNKIEQIVRNFVGGIWGSKSSEIKFLQTPQDIEGGNGQQVISEPFDSPDLATAQKEAQQFYELQKGKVQRGSGNLYANVTAEQTPDGKYIVTGTVL